MPTILDKDLPGPGTHALIIGVSHYPHVEDGEDPTPDGEAFQIGQLSSAARSASEFAAWLVDEYHNSDRPLKSLRIALSPSPGEIIHPDIQDLLPPDHAATRSNVEADLAGFRDACDSDTRNIAFVYIAGHGVQLTKHGAIVLLHDFAARGQLNRLQGAIDVAGVHAGMNHPDTAQTQFWFSDACRQKPDIAEKFETLAGALTLDEPNGATTTSPLFLAATTGNLAYGKPGGVSLFNEGLMWSLRDGGAAEGPQDAGSPWRATVTKLIKCLPAKVKELARQYNEKQPVHPAGQINEGVLHYYPQIPQSDLTVNLNPANLAASARASLFLNASVPVIVDSTEWPLHLTVDSGMYLLSVSTDSHAQVQDILDVKPPQFNRDFTVQ